jgi:hypothetical protein
VNIRYFNSFARILTIIDQPACPAISIGGTYSHDLFLFSLVYNADTFVFTPATTEIEALMASM